MSSLPLAGGRPLSFKLHCSLPGGRQEARRVTLAAPLGGLLAALVAHLQAVYAPLLSLLCGPDVPAAAPAPGSRAAAPSSPSAPAPPSLRFLLHYDDGEDLCAVSSESELREAMQLQLQQSEAGALPSPSAPFKLWVRVEAGSGASAPASLASLPRSPAHKPAIDQQAREMERTPGQAARTHSGEHERDFATPLQQEEPESAGSDDEYVRLEEEEEREEEVERSKEVARSEEDVPAMSVPLVEEPAERPSEEVLDVTAHHALAQPLTPLSGEHHAHENKQLSYPSTTTSASSPSLASSSDSSTAPSAPAAAAPVPAVHKGIICDGCGEHDIRGVRYHCTTCVDVPGGFDLCAACEARGDKHPPAHTLLKMRVPAAAAAAAGVTPAFVRAVQHNGHSYPATLPQAMLVSDEQIAIGVDVRPGSTVRKIWRIQNVGRSSWPAGSRLVFVGGDLLPGSDALLASYGALVPQAEPNEIVNICIDVVVPHDAGNYRSSFRLETAEGEMFGQRMWLSFCVPNNCPAQAKSEADADEKQAESENECECGNCSASDDDSCSDEEESDEDDDEEDDDDDEDDDEDESENEKGDNESDQDSEFEKLGGESEADYAAAIIISLQEYELQQSKVLSADSSASQTQAIDSPAGPSAPIRELHESSSQSLASASSNHSNAVGGSQGAAPSAFASHLSFVSSTFPGFEYSHQLAMLRSMGFTDVHLGRYQLLNFKGDLNRTVSWMIAHSNN